MSVYRYDGVIRNAVGYCVPGVEVYVVTQPNSVNLTDPSIPPSPLASLFTDSTGATSLANPVTTDGNGNFFFYAATAAYTLVYFDPLNRIPTQAYPDQQVVTQGGGSVTSVALTMDGVFFAAVVPGSPVTSSGTFVPALIVQNANTFPAGPASGPAATPAWRTLVAADLPGGVGSVTSVAITLTGSALLSLSVSGSPITTNGTIALTVNFASQAANTVLAGPTSGSSGAVSARTLVGADVCAVFAIASSATPNCDCSQAALPTFVLTLTSNTAPTVVNATPGQIVTFKIISPATWVFTWPTSFHGASNVDTTQAGTSVQSFVAISATEFRATGPGSFVSN